MKVFVFLAELLNIKVDLFSIFLLLVCCYNRHYICGSLAPPHKGLGIPPFSRLSYSVNGSDICNIFLGLLNQFREPSQDASSNRADLNSTS